MGVNFSDKAWDDYNYWQTKDGKTVKKINALIKSIQRFHMVLIETKSGRMNCKMIWDYETLKKGGTTSENIHG
jgi:Txe/YoeB family toxin of Txe-Axe toxin-antitoxin module